MKQYLLIIFLCLLGGLDVAEAQETAILERLRTKMEQINAFSATVRLETDIDFIRMPVKTARMSYEREQPVKLTSEDFVLVPKRGLDLVMWEIFKYDYIAVPRGEAEKNNTLCTVLHVIPDDKKAQYAIATLFIDRQTDRLVEAEIQTRKQGAYTLTMDYAKPEDLLPEKVEVSFEVEKVKIPIRYLAREGEVNREAYKSDGVKTGKVVLYFDDYEIALKG
ncbi:hypothetical protein [Robertkochia sediminum]|uniref:hypothetical protein n=1 Tax=Robertkochia sediminum TaxID=2785326 RepID=UPI0019313460|nr:hypothetical protein [Robertkochia sediminum]MBL7472698.1 hypothetical protein [Robertkochia sediminum]